MRIDRRSSVAGIALIGVAFVLVYDVVGVRSGVEAWYEVTDPATGGRRAVAETLIGRAERVGELQDALATDPALSLALFAVGAGFGLIAGSVLAYRHQRRRLRRGEHDG